MKALFLIGLTSVGLTGGFLFHQKHEVLQVEKKILSLEDKIRELTENLTILQTEWSYLTTPQRLNELARHYFPQARSVQKAQIKQIKQLLMEEPIMTACHP